MKLIWHLECWLDAMADSIDASEKQAGVTQDTNNYSDIAEQLRSRVVSHLFDAGISPKWAYQQSVGSHVIVQSADTGEHSAFEAAMDAERGFVDEQVRAEAQSLAEFKAQEVSDATHIQA